MHITVAGKQVDTGDALRAHVQDGLGVITNKYFDHAVEANVTFRRSRAAFSCDINLKAGRGLLMRGEGEGPDAHRAFSVAAEHVAKRLRRYRRRVNEHARSAAEEREAPEPATQYVLRPEDGEDVATEAADGAAHGNGTDHGAIVAEHPAEIARLTVGEAVMRMDLAHAPVLMFRNRASGTLNVVYRRSDGHVGWIDPAGR